MKASKYQLQSVLFSPKPKRLSLQQLSLLSDSYGYNIRVNIWRNHAFEPIASLTRPYFDYGCWQVQFKYSSYDDSLMFEGHADADVELLWLDSERYSSNNCFETWLDWLQNRLKVLRSITKVPIIIATWVNTDLNRRMIQDIVDTLPAVYFADVGKVCEEIDVPLIDRRTAVIAGTSIAAAVQPILARKIACHWLPATMFPPIKAVALDLDNTLHEGILGEDGIGGVRLTPQHREFQLFIKSLRQRGVFIALVSRNEKSDVERLFYERTDYPLRWDDFSDVEISWGDKVDAIMRIASKLHIAPDAVLFVDDNLGELVAVTSRLPSVHTIYAHPDANFTQRAVEYYPGLWRWRVEPDDLKRVNDLKANSEREALFARAANLADYFFSLDIVLTFWYNSIEQLPRLADLCNKTNQFNLALQRFNQAEIAERLKHSDTCVASVQLSDRLSDSGVIAVVIAERDSDRLTIEELCISCRAMGRQLEDTIIIGLIRNMALLQGCNEVVFRVQHGLRNQPALHWLARLLEVDEVPEPGLHVIPVNLITRFQLMEGIKMIRGRP